MRKHPLAFLDVETTGLDPSRHEIIELACLVVRQVPVSSGASRGPQLETVGELDLKIKPQNLAVAEPEALRINRYNEADWLFAVSLPQALTALNDLVAGAVLVAQNVSFDWSFLQQAYRQCRLEPKFHYHRLDLISMAFAKLYHQAKPERFSLAALADYFGIKNEQAHQALSDVRTTFAIYKKLLEI